MVINANERSAKKPAKQGDAEGAPEPIKIGASTPYDFDSKNLTAYGGLLPVATMLEKLKFRQLVEETLTVTRVTRAMPWYQFVLSMVLALYVGFSRLPIICDFWHVSRCWWGSYGCWSCRRSARSGVSWPRCI